MTDQRFKVTVYYRNKPEKVFRNQTAKQVKKHEVEYINSRGKITHIDVTKEPNINIVK